MARLDGRVAIVTGAGRGLGREYALFLAREGAAVVVNDLGGSVHGQGADQSPAQQVVEEIEGFGGRAVASGHDVSNWQQASEMVQLAIDTYGDLHVLVNNAGILRDRFLGNMSEEEWDAVIRVHLKGHAAPARHAVTYWREQSKAGHEADRSVVHTSSISGLAGSFGQANYSAAKLGVVALSAVIMKEARRYGVRSNVVSPSARTRLSLSTPGVEEALKAPDDPNAFDMLDPANVAPIVGWLAAPDCPATGQIYHVNGNQLLVFAMPPVVHELETDGRWTLDALDRELPSRLVTPPEVEDFF